MLAWSPRAEHGCESGHRGAQRLRIFREQPRPLFLAPMSSPSCTFYSLRRGPSYFSASRVVQRGRRARPMQLSRDRERARGDEQFVSATKRGKTPWIRSRSLPPATRRIPASFPPEVSPFRSDGDAAGRPARERWPLFVKRHQAAEAAVCQGDYTGPRSSPPRNIKIPTYLRRGASL